jgi:hypothetical protein
MKKLYRNSVAFIKRHSVKAGTAVGTGLVSVKSFAIDTTAIGTAITAAETDGLTVGEMVIATVATLVVIGLIIGIVKKI